MGVITGYILQIILTYVFGHIAGYVHAHAAIKYNQAVADAPKTKSELETALDKGEV